MAETTCKTPGCDKPASDTKQGGRCNKCHKIFRETMLAMGLWESRRDKPKAEKTPKKRGYTYKYKRDGRVGGVNDLPECIVDECPRYEGKFGGAGRCKPHFEEYRDACVAAGEQCPMSNAQVEMWGDTPGFHIEDWPEDQHAGLSVDGKCSAPWGCDRNLADDPKSGRGLCARHSQQWHLAYKRRGLPVPKRQHGNPHPACRMPDDDVIVEAIKIHGSYTATAKALGFSEGSLRDYMKIRPELKARVDAEWRLVYRPRMFTDEERRDRARQSSREKNRRRRLVPQQRIDYAGVTEDEALEVVARAKELETEPCAYCNRFFPGKMQIDHIVALTRGGDVRAANLASACRQCNMSKSDRNLDEFLAATVEVRAAWYAEWVAEQQPIEPPPDIEVLAIETGTAPPVSTSPEQLCLAFPGEALTTSGDANAGPRPRAKRAGRRR